MPVYPSTGLQLGNIKMYAYDDQPPDAFGTYWGLTQLDGWEDGWEGTSSPEQRSQQDGVWIGPQYAGGRVIHVGGTIEDISWDGVTRAWDRLLVQLPFVATGPITVSMGEGSEVVKTALIRQHEKPILSERFGERAEFSLSLLAPDPRRYAVTPSVVDLVLPLALGGIAPPLTPPLTVVGTSTVSQATLTNDGTVTTYPILTITGPCPPATIVNLTTSEALRVVDEVPAGQTLVIDVLNGTATNGGQYRNVRGVWWGLVPGINQVSFMASSYDAGAQLSISYRSAWK